MHQICKKKIPEQNYYLEPYRERVISAMVRPLDRPLHVEILELQFDLSAKGRNDVPVAADPMSVAVRITRTLKHTWSALDDSAALWNENMMQVSYVLFLSKMCKTFGQQKVFCPAKKGEQATFKLRRIGSSVEKNRGWFSRERKRERGGRKNLECDGLIGWKRMQKTEEHCGNCTFLSGKRNMVYTFRRLSHSDPRKKKSVSLQKTAISLPGMWSICECPLISPNENALSYQKVSCRYRYSATEDNMHEDLFDISIILPGWNTWNTFAMQNGKRTLHIFTSPSSFLYTRPRHIQNYTGIDNTQILWEFKYGKSGGENLPFLSAPICKWPQTFMCFCPRHSNRFPLTLDASVDPDDEAALPLVVSVGFEDERGLVARGLDVAGTLVAANVGKNAARWTRTHFGSVAVRRGKVYKEEIKLYFLLFLSQDDFFYPPPRRWWRSCPWFGRNPSSCSRRPREGPTRSQWTWGSDRWVRLPSIRSSGCLDSGSDDLVIRSWLCSFFRRILFRRK